ncbi:ABC transporter ATP-binding protein [Paenibacillus albus]|uniref:ABC transporter ATP-binding protein n=1 Tax=Paenibacillus albus TaxID=2495582 RepID=A0A3S9A7E5_9BACL|nr:ABC transporter ATP-binding protein [Paenibacillus albus]AZN41650.1 ABC transporter ATP-binding protein [Paenibacillus albus]
MWEALREPFRYPKPLGKDAEQGVSSAGKRPKAQAKDWQGTLRRIWHYLSHRRGRLSIVMLLVIGSCGLTLLGPYLIGMAIDDYLEGPGGRPWLLFLFGLTSVYVLQSIVGWLQNIWMIQIAQETVLRMRADLFAQLHRLPIPFFGKNRQGDLMSRMTNDIDSVSSTLNSSAIQLLSSVLMLGGTVVVMLLLSPLLTLLTFFVVPLMVLGMRWITRRTGALFKERQRNLGELNGFVEETLSGQRIIKAFSQEERVIREFHERNVRIKYSGFWAQTISGFIPKLMNGLNNLSFAVIACVGGILAIRGAITVGVIIVFVEYARQFTRPLNDLANQWNTLLSAIAGAERVFEIVDEQEEDVDEHTAVALDAVAGAIVFHKVSFAYEAGRNTLKEISFEAKPGETIAIIGPTGAGKTSLIQLLSRFYDTDGGTITLDGRDIRTIKRESLRSHMAFVLQDSFLFEGTIRDNIRYGKLDATDSQVEEAAKLANAHSFIMRLPGGYDRKLLADGSGISQGQRQLLAIARAILADPAILVLDEATSSIDTVSEIKIQEGLKRLMEGRTSFVIAHRLNTIREADRILVLKDGFLVEQGPHEDLLRKQGLYSDLYHGSLTSKRSS